MTGVLRLWAGGLLSKWGFDDGDMPAEVLCAIDDPRGVDWRDDVLVRLVKERLIPLLDEPNVVTYTISTAHNPIRIESIDGVPVPDGMIYDPRDESLRLSVEWIEVPMDDVLELCYQSRQGNL